MKLPSELLAETSKVHADLAQIMGLLVKAVERKEHETVEALTVVSTNTITELENLYKELTLSYEQSFQRMRRMQ